MLFKSLKLLGSDVTMDFYLPLVLLPHLKLQQLQVRMALKVLYLLKKITFTMVIFVVRQDYMTFIMFNRKVLSTVK